MLDVVIIGYGEMFTNLIAGALDANCNIVGVFRSEMIKYNFLYRKIKDIFNPSLDYNYIKSYNLHEIKAKSVNSKEFKDEILKLNPDIILVDTVTYGRLYTFKLIYTPDSLVTYLDGVKKNDVALNDPNIIFDISKLIKTIGSADVSYANRPFYGSINLNAFKVWIDGSLAYQPCLKIPYTESKTGSKIVNSIYRDRVNDMYEQFGHANYYTLGANDFTLPMGEIYGMIENLRKLIIERTSEQQEE